MEISLKDESLVKEVQIQFNAYFPYLQLQFARYSQSVHKPHLKNIKARPDDAIKQFGQFYSPAIISIGNTTTVADLITDFWRIGLRVQVWRKSANLWVETSLTLDWTLERQNKEAILIST